MSSFSEWLKQGQNVSKKSDIEYYEDTHDEDGNYAPQRPVRSAPRQSDEGSRHDEAPYSQRRTSDDKAYSKRRDEADKQYSREDIHPAIDRDAQIRGREGMSLPSKNDFVTNRNYQNVVVYEPSTPEDVQTLIDYLKRKEPAIINLDKVEESVSQRILDFISGAIYALNGSVHRIAGNIFLLSPEGVEITVPYDL